MGKGVKLLTLFIKRIIGSGKEKLSKFQKFRLGRHSRKQLQENTKLSNFLKNSIAKDLSGAPLNNDEKETLALFENIVQPAIKEPETRKIKSASGNFIKATYWRSKKKCVVKMRRGVGDYTFNKVSVLHWLALCDIGGKYMWDFFGKKYSTNPYHWVRKSKMIRKTTKNYTKTKAFRTKYKGKYY